MMVFVRIQITPIFSIFIIDKYMQIMNVKDHFRVSHNVQNINDTHQPTIFRYMRVAL